MRHHNSLMHDMLKFVPWDRFEQLVDDHGGNRRVRTLDSVFPLGQADAEDTPVLGNVRKRGTRPACRRPDRLPAAPDGTRLPEGHSQPAYIHQIGAPQPLPVQIDP